MPIKILGSSGAVVDVEGNGYNAMEATMLPTDHGSLGAYRVDALRNDLLVSANMPANSFFFSFWWRDPTRICVVTQVVFNGMAGGPIAFTAGSALFELFVARAWTTDATGGSTILPTGSGGSPVERQNMRETMNSTLVASCRASGGGTLTAGAWVLDAHPIGQCMGAVGTTAGTQWIPRTQLYAATANDGPLVIHQNEGLTLRGTVPGTGTWRFGVTVCWYELTAF